MRPMMRTMHALCPLSLLLGAAACGPGDAVSFPTAMSLNACDEHIIVADLPPEAARRIVDARYTPTINSRGQAVGFISTYRCDQVGVGARNYPAGFLSYFSVVLDIPPGLPNDDDDLHQYVLWATTNQPALEQAFERAGIPVYRTDDITLRLDATTRNTTVEHGGTASPFTATTTVEMTYDEPEHEHDFFFWSVGSQGPVELAAKMKYGLESVGTVAVQYPSGNRLADFLEGATIRRGLISQLKGATGQLMPATTSTAALTSPTSPAGPAGPAGPADSAGPAGGRSVPRVPRQEAHKP